MISRRPAFAAALILLAAPGIFLFRSMPAQSAVERLIGRAPTQELQIAPYLSNPPAVIPIDTGRQLFVDNFLIEQTNLARVPHRPVMYAGNPVLTPGPRDTVNLAMPYSDGVWFDPSDQLFKMWYD